MRDRFGIEPLNPDGNEWYSQMALVEVPPIDPGELHQRLMMEHDIEIPCMRHGETTCVRLSVQGYVTDADLDALACALDTIFA